MEVHPDAMRLSQSGRKRKQRKVIFFPGEWMNTKIEIIITNYRNIVFEEKTGVCFERTQQVSKYIDEKDTSRHFC